MSIAVTHSEKAQPSTPSTGKWMDRELGAAGQQGREDTARRPEFLHYIGDSLAASSEGEKAREMPQARVDASAPGPEMLPCQHLFKGGKR